MFSPEYLLVATPVSFGSIPSLRILRCSDCAPVTVLTPVYTYYSVAPPLLLCFSSPATTSFLPRSCFRPPSATLCPLVRQCQLFTNMHVTPSSQQSFCLVALPSSCSATSTLWDVSVSSSLSGVTEGSCPAT
ncbi:uncharacterized protein BJX67DRAFT_74836 [Aspergillus lucknowensis]|uniref:Uncharacterized protein n=1 Tax=Aspergillus lucknowensis TaxID=176173 RepID=A0ABR4LU21_9EURO